MQLFVVSDKYGVTSLQLQCAQALRVMLTVQNLVHVERLAAKYHCLHLTQVLVFDVFALNITHLNWWFLSIALNSEFLYVQLDNAFPFANVVLNVVAHRLRFTFAQLGVCHNCLGYLVSAVVWCLSDS